MLCLKPAGTDRIKVSADAKRLQVSHERLGFQVGRQCMLKVAFSVCKVSLPGPPLMITVRGNSISKKHVISQAGRQAGREGTKH